MVCSRLVPMSTLIFFYWYILYSISIVTYSNLIQTQLEHKIKHELNRLAVLILVLKKILKQTICPNYNPNFTIQKTLQMVNNLIHKSHSLHFCLFKFQFNFLFFISNLFYLLDIFTIKIFHNWHMFISFYLLFLNWVLHLGQLIMSIFNLR